MKLDWKLVMVLVLSLGLFVGCEKDEEEEAVGTYTDLADYMISAGKDLPAMLGSIGGSSWVVSAASVLDVTDSTAVSGFTVLDVRGATDFAAGHIKDAINTTIPEVLDVAAANTGPFLVVCYTGQSAGHAVMALRLSGYEASVLKWGFSGWHSDFSTKWDNGIGNSAVDNANWVKTASPAVGSYDAPDWESTETEGEALLAERVQAMLDAGFQATSGSGLLADPASMQIINYWSEAHYTTYGHFNGAVQYNTISLADDMVSAVDPSVPTAIYCYTGQTSSMITAWLNVLGYDAKSVGYGVNGLNYDEMDAGFAGTSNSKKMWHGSADYPYVTD